MLLAPDAVEAEAVLMGTEPSGLALSMLTKQLPVEWEEQRGSTGGAFVRVGSGSVQSSCSV